MDNDLLHPFMKIDKVFLPLLKNDTTDTYSSGLSAYSSVCSNKLKLLRLFLEASEHDDLYAIILEKEKDMRLENIANHFKKTLNNTTEE